MERLRRSSRLASRELRLKTDFGSNSDLHMSGTERIIKGLILILPWKTTEQDCFCYLFGVADRFDWINFDVWLKYVFF